MRIHVVAVGRARAGPEKDLFDHYARRISFPLTLREVEEKRPMTVDRRKAAEAELLLGAAPAGARIVALDEKGRSLASTALAEILGGWRDEGIQDIAFLIGGADGLDETVRRSAALVLSFGTMTWPHMLVRGMLAEQIYRAQTILSGHPYHRG